MTCSGWIHWAFWNTRHMICKTFWSDPSYTSSSNPVLTEEQHHLLQKVVLLWIIFTSLFFLLWRTWERVSLLLVQGKSSNVGGSFAKLRATEPTLIEVKLSSELYWADLWSLCWFGEEAESGSFIFISFIHSYFAQTHAKPLHESSSFCTTFIYFKFLFFVFFYKSPTKTQWNCPRQIL